VLWLSGKHEETEEKTDERFVRRERGPPHASRADHDLRRPISATRHATDGDRADQDARIPQRSRENGRTRAIPAVARGETAQSHAATAARCRPHLRGRDAGLPPCAAV